MKKLVVVSLTILLNVFLAFGQTTTGRLVGIVSGPDGVLPSATVTAKDNKTGKELTVVSKEDGAFAFPQLEFGTYTVTVTSQGFKTFVANEVKVDVGREYSLNPVLEIGNIQESVTVTAGADVVTANSAQVTNTVSPQQIQSLPLVTRNPLSLTTLQAGVQSNPFQGTTINGMRTSMTNITRDGINIQDAYIKTNATDFAPGRPSTDDTAEFTISTSNQEADQGSGGSQIRLVTPRGTKELSGAVYGYNRNSELSANNFFNNRQGLARPFRNRNNFGGKVSRTFPIFNFGEGGPMFVKDKAFFFFNYDKIIDPVSARGTRTILTPGARTGEFRYTRATAGPAINQTIGGATVICPETTANNTGTCVVSNILQFANGRGLSNIPTTIDPIIQARVISLLPATGNITTTGDQLNTTGFTLNRNSDQERTTVSSRIDIDFNEKHTFNGVYSWNRELNLRPDVDTTAFTTFPQASQTSTNKTLSMAVRSILTSNIVNEIRGGSFFSNVPFFRNSAAPALPNYFLALPLVTNPELTFLDQGRQTGNKTITDNVDWIAGKHNLRFGGQLQFYKVNTYNQGGTVPTYSIGTATTTPQFTCNTTATCQFPGGISTTQLGTANGLLALLGGIVNAGSQTYNLLDATSGFTTSTAIVPYRYSNHAFYVSDRWQIRPDLTITGGVRYELYPAIKLANGLGLEVAIADTDNPVQSILDSGGTYQFIGGNSGVRNTFYKTDYNNFAPQFGFAWSPKFENGIGKFLLGESFVLRGGYSQAYAMESILRAVENAYTGNQGLAGTVGRSIIGGSTSLDLRLSQGGLPATTAPTFAAPPYTFISRNNSPFSNFFGTVWAIDPNLQIPKIEQYSLGIQREIFGNMAFEARYVGTRSKSLIRGVDYNQVDIFNNGFLADFERARANLALTGDAFCTTATNAGCQALQIFRATGVSGGAGIGGAPGRLLVGASGTTGGVAFPAGLSLATFTNALRGGVPADLAISFINSAANLNNHPTNTSPGNTPFVRFLANPGTGVVDFLSNDGAYFYNSLQLELRRRFTNGLYFQANYTYSRNISNAIGTAQTLFEPYLDNNNTSLDYARADYDQTHAFNFNGVYQLPFGKGKSFLNYGGVADKVFGGWEISGIVQMASGAPITFTDARGTLNRAGRSGRQTANSSLSIGDIQNLVGVFEDRGNIYFINPAVIDPATGRASNGFGQTPFNGQVFFNVDPGKTGTLPRTIINGPAYFNVNAALLKNIRFTERMRLQIRGEAFNLFNTVNFINNTQFADISSTTFGQITSTFAARTVQLGVRFEF